MTVTIWRASLWTSHFRFEAVGSSRPEAIKALQAGFRAHANEYDLQSDWAAADYESEIDVRPLDLGESYRDGEKLVMRPRQVRRRSRRSLMARTYP